MLYIEYTYWQLYRCCEKKETAQWIVTVLAELLGVRQRINIEGNISIYIRRLKKTIIINQISLVAKNIDITY